MAIFEWRKFNFFDLKAGADSGNIKQILTDDEQITSTTYGNGQVIIGDSGGQVHVFRKNWSCFSFKAHNGPVLLSKFCKSNNLLVTIGSDETTDDIPSFKVWNLSQPLREGQTPLCLRTCKIAVNKPTALDISENGQFMAIGFSGGDVSLYKGDIGRDRSNNYKSLVGGSTAITGIAFRALGKVTQMYVCSKTDVLVFNLAGRDREQKVVLDQTNIKDHGAIRCSTLQTGGEKYFLVGRDKAIFCFTSEYKGPCYVLDGEKCLIDSFRTYIIIISRPTKKAISSQKDCILTVIDIKNKFIVFSSPIDRVSAIIMDFGSCFILTEQKEIFHLDEKDLQVKLSLLLKKNLLDIAVHVAKSGDYDAENLTLMIRQYGDHLYSKNDFQGAIDQYIKIIDHLEPSYVIMKYLDSRHIDCLTLYLKQLHQCGKATAAHTTLLLNCFTRLDPVNDVRKCLEDDQTPKIMFDMDIVIQTLRSASVDYALELAKENNRHKHCISILIEDLKQYEEALKYIASLDVAEAEENMSRYGTELMQNCPKHTTALLKRICAEYGHQKEQPEALDWESVFEETRRKRGDPENYLHLFAYAPEYLSEFLEYLIEHVPNSNSKSVLNALIESYLEQWSKAAEGETKDELSNQILDLLQKHCMTIDKNQVLVHCKLHNFLPGILWIYEEEELYHLIVRHYLKGQEYEKLLKTCGRLEKLRPNLWLQALTGLRGDTQATKGMLAVVLNVIAQQKLQSPWQVLNCLVADGNGPQFSDVRNYLLQVFSKEDENFRRESEQVKKSRLEGQQWREHLRKIREQPIEFMASNCEACQQPLSNPTIHYLCQHSFHQDCVRGYSDTEKVCSVCQTNNAGIMDKLKAQQESRSQHQKFHDLNRSSEPFAEVAKYFGHGLFNQLVIFDENDLKPSPERRSVAPESVSKRTAGTPISESGGGGGYTPKTAVAPAVNTNFGTGAEAKMRVAETRSNVMAAPISEARMRLQEQQVNKTNIRYSSGQGTSNDWAGRRGAGADKGKVTPSQVPTPVAPVIKQIPVEQSVKKQVAVAAPAKTYYPKSNNPFGDDDAEANPTPAPSQAATKEYDRTLDPFANDADEDDDVNNNNSDNYDKSLNPFE